MFCKGTESIFQYVRLKLRNPVVMEDDRKSAHFPLCVYFLPNCHWLSLVALLTSTLHSCLFVFLPLIDCVKKNAIFKLVLVQILLLISNKIVKPDSFLWLSNKKRKNNWVKTWKSNYPFKIYQFHCLFPLFLLPLHPIIEIKTLDTGRCIVLVHVLLFSFCMSSSL